MRDTNPQGISASVQVAGGFVPAILHADGGKSPISKTVYADEGLAETRALSILNERSNAAKLNTREVGYIVLTLALVLFIGHTFGLTSLH